MALVPTARGDEIDTSELGLTLTHEHVFALSPEVNQNYPETLGDEDSLIKSAVDELDAAKAKGVNSIVDLTVLGLGRFVPRVKRVAMATDVNIIVATGAYFWSDLPMFFSLTGPGTHYGGPEPMTDLFVRDIEQGIGDTGVRAGILKCATHTPGITAGVERVLRAVAQAHRRTGVPITTHTFEIPNAADQQRVFTEEGVDLSRVVIGHIDKAATENLDYVKEVMAKGSFISFDTFGLEGITPDATRVDRIATLCDDGHVDQIVLSHDHAVFADMAPPNPLSTYTRVLDYALPALRERGITDDQINQMLVVNPRRIFETVSLGPY